MSDRYFKKDNNSDITFYKESCSVLYILRSENNPIWMESIHSSFARMKSFSKRKYPFVIITEITEEELFAELL